MPIVQSKRLLLRLWHCNARRLLIFAILGPVIYGVLLAIHMISLGAGPTSEFPSMFFRGWYAGLEPLLLSAVLDAFIRNVRLAARIFLMIYLGYFVNVATWIFYMGDSINANLAPVILLCGSLYGVIPAAICSWLSNEMPCGAAQKCR